LGLTFFGLTLQHRTTIFTQIHQIVFHGNGGYDWNTVYNMPIWLRNFTYTQIKEHYVKQNEETEKVNSSIKSKSNTKIARPNFTTKAPK